MNQRSNKITPVILVGGKSKRYGEDKALLEFLGEPLLLRIKNIIFDAFGIEPVFIGRNSLPFGLNSFPDIYPERGPLGGLYTAFKHVKTNHIFLSACDMPFIKKEIIEYMIRKYDFTSSIYIPRFNNFYIEPLFAIYSKTLNSKVENLILDGDFRMRSVLVGEKIQYLNQNEIELLDPELLTFFNINTKSDYERIKLSKNEKS